MAPVDVHGSAVPGAIPRPQIGENLRSGRTAVQNFTPIGKAPAEKSVSVHTKNKQYTFSISIPPYTTYGGIKSSTH